MSSSPENLSSASEPEQSESIEIVEESLADAEGFEPDFSEEEDVSATTPPLETPKPRFTLPRNVLILLNLLSVVIIVVIYLLRINPVAGLFVDDGWYIVLAKALATGNGYTLINSPTPGILPLYPPGFPFLLSIVFLVFPSFPENVWALKMVSVLAVFGVGIISYLYFSQLRELPKPLSAILAFVVLTCTQNIFYATETVMSESVYSLALIATIFLAEKKLQKQTALQTIWYVGLLAGYAYLVRSTGIAVIAAIALCLLKDRLTKSLMIFAGSALAIILPWMLYSKMHTLTPEMRAEQNSYIVQSYSEAFWRVVATDEESGQITITELPQRVLNNFGQIALRDMGRILISPIADSLIYNDIQQNAISNDGNIAEINSSSIFSIILTFLVGLGLISALREKIRVGELVVIFSIGITLLWPWEVLRFMVPLAPFLFFYLIKGIGVIHGIFQRLNEINNPFTRHYGGAVLLILFLLINFYAQYVYISRMNSGKTVAGRDWIATFNENKAMMDWIKENTVDDAVLATDNPPLDYLYTGRKTVGMSFPERQWELWKKLGVTHLVRGSSVVIEGADEQESRFSIPYRSKGGLNLRILDLGPVDSRKKWVNQ